ncbi:MAG TPA: metallophosphoesterase [Vicinamibacterales bacterium]
MTDRHERRAYAAGEASGGAPAATGAHDGHRRRPSAVRRIWDLRLGDADDNRASPPGRGWRGVVVALALDFNYLTALIGFVALVLLPALLLGLAPSLMLTYGRQKIAAAAVVGSHPVAAVVSLALLLAAAYWIGRPLFRMARESLWHLQHTFVFPMFVALRETVSAGLERLPGPAGASARLDRRRRLGAIVASLLLAGGGLGLAWSVGVLTNPVLADLLARPGVVVQAGLRNAALLLGLSTTASSLYWLWQELTRRRPLRDWSPGPPPGGGTTIRVAHLSDLHVVGERYGCRMECGTHGPRGNDCVRFALQQLQAMHAASPLDCILVTGDVTDAGTRAEWAEFVDLLRACPGIRKRMLFVPGNHDVNIVDRTNTGRVDIPWSASHALRRLRFVLALDAMQGARLHLVDHSSGALGTSLRQHLRAGDRPARLRALARAGTFRGRQEMAAVWEDLFPLVLPPRGQRSWGAILLESNARSHFSATNAIGVVGPRQLAALRAVLGRFPGSAWLLLLHHHVVEYPTGTTALADRIALSLMNAPEVLHALAPHASRVVVFHGHRHHDWIGRAGDVVLCSAPSVALGSVGPDLYQGSFHLNELAMSDGALHLVSSERVPVQAHPA